MENPTVRVLVVEDSPSDAQLIRLALRQAPGARFDMVVVERLDMAIALLREQKLDVVLLDLGLPDSTGFATFKRVQTLFPALPVVIMTGAGGDAAGVEAIRGGVQDYLVKGSADAGTLARSIRYAIERKRSEESVLRAKEEWERTFDSVPDLIVILDGQHRVVRANRAMAERLGATCEQCVGLPCYKAVHGADTPPDFCPHARTIVDGMEHTTEVHEDRLGGDFLVSTTPMFGPEGGLTGSVHVARDITARKQAEEALKKLNEELESRVAKRTEDLTTAIEKLHVETAERLRAMEALREKEVMLVQQSRQAAMGEMIGNIAHQWRQPLNALGLTVQQLSFYYDLGEFNKELLDKSVSRSMELIGHMSRTIDDFRNYFRPDKEKAEFNVRAAIAMTLSLIEAGFRNQHIGLEVVANDDPVIYGHKNEFAQVLLNILNNARDAVAERGIDAPRVTVTVGTEEGHVVVTVADNAGGVPEEIMGKIFDPYFTTKGPQAGTGVGLFMSKAIIEKNMGGRLTVRNIADGAEFRIEV
ncbi:MAG: response regulator [Deltaproteobacteria bacterium]|nr:response regulator [Deltaproteobacteria bacterium]